MFEDVEVQSLTKAGVVFLVYLFMVILVYFALSVPINTIFNGFESANWAAAEPHRVETMANIRQACTIFFAIFISIPVCWFFFWVFHREPRYGPQDNFNQWR